MAETLLFPHVVEMYWETISQDLLKFNEIARGYPYETNWNITKLIGMDLCYRTRTYAKGKLEGASIFIIALNATQIHGCECERL